MTGAITDPDLIQYLQARAQPVPGATPQGQPTYPNSSPSPTGATGGGRDH